MLTVGTRVKIIGNTPLSGADYIIYDNLIGKYGEIVHCGKWCDVRINGHIYVFAACDLEVIAGENV